MDSDTYGFLNAFAQAMSPAIVIYFIMKSIIKKVGSQSQNSYTQKANALNQLTADYKDKSGFLTNNIEELDRNTYQFYGNVLNIDLMPGTTLWLNGIGYEVVKVYSDDEQEDVEDAYLPAGARNAVIVFTDLTKDHIEVRNLPMLFETRAAVLFSYQK